MIEPELRMPTVAAVSSRAQPIRAVHALRHIDRRYVHAAPLALLAAADGWMLRNILFGRGLPSGVDSAFLYSALNYYTRHGLSTFTIWLASPLGEIQQYSLYWALSGVASIAGHPLFVYKMAMAAIIAVTTVGSYGLAFHLTSDRIASCAAAFIYGFSPFAVAQWFDGHMNVQISYALGPCALWALMRSLETGSWRAGLALGASGSGLFLLTTGQGAYWALPLVLIMAYELARGPRRAVAGRIVRTSVISLAVFVPLSAVQLVPYAVGARAPFVAGGGSYYIEQLSIHRKYSLPFWDGVAGVPRETYLPGPTGVAWGGVASWQIDLLGLLLAAAAFSSLATRRWRLGVPFAAAAVVSWLLAAGPSGPAGGAYVFLYEHLPLIRFLRVPNRWLMVADISVAVLLALFTVEARGWARVSRRKLIRRLPLHIVVVAGIATIVCSTRGFSPGLTTWEPPASFAAVYGPLKSDQDDWRILTTPYFQSWMGSSGRLGNDQLITADLGYTSTYWHGHAVLGRGGWDPRGSRFAKYLYEVVKQGTSSSSLPKLLGAIDVKYIALDPQPAIEAVAGQNTFFRHQRALERVASAGGITLFRNPFVLPQTFRAESTCVVVGGFGVLDGLASLPAFQFNRTVPVFADQIGASEGRTGLIDALRTSRCVVVAPGGLAALRVMLESTGIVDIVQTASGSWTRSETSPIVDINAEPSTVVDVPNGATWSGMLDTGAAPSQQSKVWVLGLSDRDAPDLDVTIDGKPAGRVSLNATLGSGYRWHAAGKAAQVTPGRHLVSIRVSGLRGGFAHLVRVAFVPARARQRELPIAAADLITERGGPGPVAPASVVLGRALPATTWHGLAGSPQVIVKAAGSKATLGIHRNGRRYFTIAATSTTGGRIDPYRAMAFRFSGRGDGRIYYLNVLFNGGRRGSFGYRIRDTSRQTRTILLSPLQPSFTTISPDWSHVAGFTFSSSTKRRTDGDLSIDGPFETSVSLAPRFSPHLSAILRRAGSAGDRSLVVVSQSFNERFTLGDVQSRSHFIAMGFANGYTAVRRDAKVRPAYSLEAVGRDATLASAGAWMILAGAFAFPLFRRKRP
jgi:hypothetical protein